MIPSFHVMGILSDIPNAVKVFGEVILQTPTPGSVAKLVSFAPYVTLG